MKLEKRKLNYIESEIVHLILFCELAFLICKSVPIIAGRGDDFLPYFFNLNYTKGIITLHALADSKSKSELSLMYYIKRLKKENRSLDTTDLLKFVKDINKSFNAAYPIKLRNKVVAHFDENYIHTGFTCSYIDPAPLDKYIKIVSDIKIKFFAYWGYQIDDDPYGKIRDQSKLLVSGLTTRT